ncbi:MAG: polyphosphate polymerase domain-containing protein [Oscillospiraceae bacterium]|nr:polyphosphate polymerase domain-containing protein [Oscillospiraceae bacterium]
MSELQSCFRRYEKKYLLTQEQYRAVKRGMAPFMKPDPHPRYTVCSVYYDTGHYDLIRASLEKPVYKEKLRLRSYGVPDGRDPVFVEVKKKYDGVVYKRRVTMAAQDAVRYLEGARNGDGSQIGRELDWFLRFYRPEPKVFIAYDREAYASADGGELRLTFDSALRVRAVDLDLRSGDHGVPLMDKDLVLMEIKIPGTAPLWLAQLLSEEHIFPDSFSKYGTYYKRFVLGGRSAAIRKEALLSA